jgi:hypothetical protein
MEVHYLIDHSVARTKLQPPGANCQVCSKGGSVGIAASPIYAYWIFGGAPPPTINNPYVSLTRVGAK